LDCTRIIHRQQKEQWHWEPYLTELARNEYFLTSNIILPSTLRSFMLFSFPQVLPQNNSCLSSHECQCPTSRISLDLISLIVYGGDNKSSGSSLHNFLNPPVTSYHVDINIPISTLFSNTVTLSLLFSLELTNQVSHQQQNKLQSFVFR
jgi:hypothetical protein